MMYRTKGVSLSAVSVVAAFVFAVAVFCVPQAAQAAPIKGSFKSVDMDGGTFLTGRYSEGYSGDPQGIGNGAHSGSWNGIALYTEWELKDLLIDDATVHVDNRPNGTVIVEQGFDTTSGKLILKTGGPWDGGDGDYTVNLDFYSQTITMLYVGDTMVFSSSVVTFTGDVAGFTDYRLEGQACGALTGMDVNPAAGGLPADFPDWIPGAATTGDWGEVGLIQFHIIPEPATLLLIGVGFGGMWLARRPR